MTRKEAKAKENTKTEPSARRSSTIIPDEQAYQNVDRDYPHASGVERYRLAQSEMRLRLCGYRRLADGSYVNIEFKAMDVIALADSGAAISDIANATGGTPEETQRLIDRLVTEGKVKVLSPADVIAPGLYDDGEPLYALGNSGSFEVERDLAQWEPDPPSTIELPLTCNCRSFTHPHEISAHAELESDHDWRTPAERKASAARKIAPVNAERATAYPWFERSTRKGE